MTLRMLLFLQLPGRRTDWQSLGDKWATLEVPLKMSRLLRERRSVLTVLFLTMLTSAARLSAPERAQLKVPLKVRRREWEANLIIETTRKKALLFSVSLLHSSLLPRFAMRSSHGTFCSGDCHFLFCRCHWFCIWVLHCHQILPSLLLPFFFLTFFPLTKRGCQASTVPLDSDKFELAVFSFSAD